MVTLQVFFPKTSFVEVATPFFCCQMLKFCYRKTHVFIIIITPIMWNLGVYLIKKYPFFLLLIKILVNNEFQISLKNMLIQKKLQTNKFFSKITCVKFENG
jgi:hypothetical protein